MDLGPSCYTPLNVSYNRDVKRFINHLGSLGRVGDVTGPRNKPPSLPFDSHEGPE